MFTARQCFRCGEVELQLGLGRSEFGLCARGNPLAHLEGDVG
jgi:hypothetical protein